MLHRQQMRKCRSLLLALGMLAIMPACCRCRKPDAVQQRLSQSMGGGSQKPSNSSGPLTDAHIDGLQHLHKSWIKGSSSKMLGNLCEDNCACHICEQFRDFLPVRYNKPVRRLGTVKTYGWRYTWWGWNNRYAYIVGNELIIFKKDKIKKRWKLNQISSAKPVKETKIKRKGDGFKIVIKIEGAQKPKELKIGKAAWKALYTKLNELKHASGPAGAQNGAAAPSDVPVMRLEDTEFNGIPTKPAKLRNGKNICYFNSALQCLMHIPGFKFHFLYICTRDKVKETPLVENFKNFLVSYGQKSMNEAKEALLKVLYERKKSISHNATLFKKGSQEDMGEALQCILEWIQEDSIMPNIENMFNCSTIDKANPEYIHSLVFPTIHEKIGVDLEEMIKAFTEYHPIKPRSEPYYFETCPEVFIAKISRDTMNPKKKIKTGVIFQEKMEIPFRGGHANYKLCAVGHHKCGAGGWFGSYGHYYVHVKNQSGDWYLASDTKIRVKNFEQVCPPNGSETASLLFYRRVNRVARVGGKL